MGNKSSTFPKQLPPELQQNVAEYLDYPSYSRATRAWKNVPMFDPYKTFAKRQADLAERRKLFPELDCSEEEMRARHAKEPEEDEETYDFRIQEQMDECSARNYLNEMLDQAIGDYFYAIDGSLDLDKPRNRLLKLVQIHTYLSESERRNLMDLLIDYVKEFYDPLTDLEFDIDLRPGEDHFAVYQRGKNLEISRLRDGFRSRYR